MIRKNSGTVISGGAPLDTRGPQPSGRAHALLAAILGALLSLEIDDGRSTRSTSATRRQREQLTAARTPPPPPPGRRDRRALSGGA